MFRLTLSQRILSFNTMDFWQKYSKKVFLLCGSLTMTFVFMQITWFNVYFNNGMYKFSRIAFTEDDLESEEFHCIDRLASKYSRVEDIFCIVLPQFLPHLKNPCFYDVVLMKKRKLRCLPYFYIIGIDKSGSTDLHSRLVKHPLVYGNTGVMKKESQYWCWNRYGIMNKRKGNPKTSFDSYLDMFEQTANLIEEKNQTSVVASDASPMDMWDFRGWTMIPQNEGLPEPKILTPHFLKYLHKKPPKLIIQLREPIERLYSDYVFLEYGKDPIDFHRHVVQAIEMMEVCLSNHSRRFCFYDADLYDKLPVRIHLSCYSVFLREWMQVFPRFAFHIIRTTEYTSDMETTLSGVFKFLELPPLSQSIMQDILNQTRRHVTADKNGVVLPETRRLLQNFYSECNQETATLLDDKRFLWLDH
ncbi:carbohydrate sulfotransferase 15-like isoform X2 [Biomphalaria glabrata]|nr:carbohydrate sulfotransferase 15-like isoform X2 [Biomphalaria glabrata]XP_055868625.1 carbohydrate sulfotransferase 15-like isoform X2 [Biomphalaria glabrata]